MSTRFRRPDSLRSGRWTRRGLLAAGLGLPLLSACSSDPDSESSDAVKMMRQSFDRMIGDDAVTRAQAGAVPYASMGVRVGGSGQVLLALATQNHDTCLWTSSVHFAIETEAGRITRTAGLLHNMSQGPFRGSDPLKSASLSAGGGCDYQIDLPDRNVYQSIIRYTMDAPTPAAITILGAKLSVLHAVEHASCAQLDWQFDNEYWIDSKTGFVWQSRQTIHPDLGAVETAVFRPPG
jgi:hypothetical protein